MLARILNTLRSRLRVEERDWRSKNEMRHQNALGWVHAAIVSMASRLKSFGWITLLASLSFLALTGLIDEERWVLFTFAEFKIDDPVDYFSALWSVQAATVALVYPIVISFVAVLLQRRPGATVALNIYLHDSAALLAGLSALLLVVLMSVQYFFLPYLSDSRLAAWLVLDGIWFLINAGLMLHFLFRTFEFIQPEHRLSIVQRYAVSVSWPEEVRGHLARHLFYQATSEGLIPGPSYEGMNDSASVSLGRHGFESGDRVVTLNLGRGSQTLVDVRFRLLGWAWSLWKSRISVDPVRLDPKSKRGYQLETAPVVFFPVDPYSSYTGEVLLCRSDGAGEPSMTVRFLIKHSFVFGSNKKTSRASTTEILDDLLAQALLSLRAGEAQSFDDDVARLTGMYVLLIRASQIASPDGQPQNVAALMTLEFFGGRRVYERWSQVFYHLIDSASKELSRGEDFVSPVLYVPGRLFSKCKAAMAPGLLLRFITMPSFYWKSIGEWWARDVATETSLVRGNADVVARLAAPSKIYNRVLHSFVGSWETFYDRLFPDRDAALDVTSLKQSAEWLNAHLSGTLVMLFDSCNRGDRVGAEWMADVLLKWYENSRHLIKESSAYSWRSDLKMITLDTFAAEDVGSIQVDSADDAESPPIMQQRFKLALKHAWVDACCVAASVLCTWMRRAESESTLYAELAAALHYGKPLRAGGSNSLERPFSSFGSLLVSLLRQRAIDRAYSKRLDLYIEAISDLTRPEMIPGRIYSSVGASNLASVDNGLLLTMMTFVGHHAGGAKFPKSIEDRLVDDPSMSAEVLRTLHTWIEMLRSERWKENSAAFEGLRMSIEGLGEFDTTTKSLASALSDLAQLIDDKRIQELRQRSIDPSRLAGIAEAASKTAFGGSTGGFPLPLFRLVTTSEVETAQDFALRISGVSRGSLITPAIGEAVLTDGAWIAEAMREHVGTMVLREVLRILKPRSVRARSSRAYWKNFKKFVAQTLEAGLSSILLLENPTVPSWVWDFAHPPWSGSSPSVQEGIELRRDPESIIDGYQWSFNDVPVFDSHIRSGASILMTRESLDEVVFVKHASGAMILVEYEPDQERIDQVTLVLRWRMRVVVAEHPSVRLAYGKSGVN